MRRTDRTIGLAWLGGLGLALHAVPAAAQYASGPSATVEVASDERRRGLSWSDGDPVLRGTLSVPVAQGLSLDGAATSLWSSDRHGGANAVIDLGPSYVHQLGGWRLSLDARYHLFPGADHQGYGELGAGASFLIGPASIDIGAQYAPRQSAIGGDNLYLSSAASFAIPGTPLTASARVGHSSGSDRDPIASQRLRPGDDYWDYGAAIVWYRGRWSAELRYSDTDIADRDARHAGSALIGKVGLTL